MKLTHARLENLFSSEAFLFWVLPSVGINYYKGLNEYIDNEFSLDIRIHIIWLVWMVEFEWEASVPKKKRKKNKRK